MKLLFDQNLSHKLPRLLADLFPNSTQVRLLDLGQADDRRIWEVAKADDYAIVTLDADFAELAQLRGAPPKVIWLRCGTSRPRSLRLYSGGEPLPWTPSVLMTRRLAWRSIDGGSWRAPRRSRNCCCHAARSTSPRSANASFRFTSCAA